MTIATVSQGSNYGLPPALQTAQEAMLLPDVQEMLHKLSAYKLGIFMPHMHDEQTGGFRPLPDNLTQVESSLEVYFLGSQKVADQTEQFLPVGWCWRAGAATATAVCEMVSDESMGDADGAPKHKMINTNYSVIAA